MYIYMYVYMYIVNMYIPDLKHLGNKCTCTKCTCIHVHVLYMYMYLLICPSQLSYCTCTNIW